MYECTQLHCNLLHLLMLITSMFYKCHMTNKNKILSCVFEFCLFVKPRHLCSLDSKRGGKKWEEGEGGGRRGSQSEQSTLFSNVLKRKTSGPASMKNEAIAEIRGSSGKSDVLQGNLKKWYARFAPLLSGNGVQGLWTYLGWFLGGRVQNYPCTGVQSWV